MEIFIIALMLGLIPASVALHKGRGFFGWWIYGSALFIVALPHALLIKTNAAELERRAMESGDAKKCPHCAEIVKADANVCKHCGRDLPAASVQQGESVRTA